MAGDITVTETSDMDRCLQSCSRDRVSKFRLQNPRLPDEVETVLCRQASLLGSVSPRAGQVMLSEAQDRVVWSRNWPFLLGLASSDLST